MASFTIRKNLMASNQLIILEGNLGFWTTFLLWKSFIIAILVCKSTVKNCTGTQRKQRKPRNIYFRDLIKFILKKNIEVKKTVT